MADDQPGLPPGYKPWPPDDLVKEIEDEWAQKRGGGKHWIVQVTGTNPLSGYTVKKEPAGGG